MRSDITFKHTFNKVALLKIISPLSPYAAVGLGLYVLGNAWITFAIYHFCLISFIIATGELGIFKKLCWGWHRLATVIAIPAGALTGIILWILWPYVALQPLQLSNQLANVGLSGTGWIIFAFIFILLNPAMEEVFWRGFLEDGKKGKLPWAADILFAGYHLPVLAFFIRSWWLVPIFVLICVGGWLWRWLCRGLDGLAVAFVSHIAADISIFVAVHIIAYQ